MRHLWILLTLMLLGCSASAQLEMETIARGYYSGIRGQEAALITSTEAWAAHWARHAGIMLPPPKVPPVDFASHSLVAVHLGERRTGGYGVTITGLHQQGKALHVTAMESRPPEGAVVTQALTQPYHIVRIPRVKDGTQLQVRWETAAQPQ